MHQFQSVDDFAAFRILPALRRLGPLEKGWELRMRVGLIGVGTMGSAIGMNILRAGYELVVHDIRPQQVAPHREAGAIVADSPNQLAQLCEVVLTSLPGPEEVEAVSCGSRGLLQGIGDGKAYFDLSTSSPALARRLHAEFLARNADMLDAPVSGGPYGAASGRLAMWIGGREQAYLRHRDLLESIGDEIWYVGESGAGSIAKLVHNCAGFIMYAALAETFSMGIKAGLAPDVLWQTVRKGLHGRRPMFDSMARNFLPSSYDDADFRLELGAKDVSLATELAAEHGVPMALAAHALEELQAALARGWADKDARVSMLLQLERAGLEPLSVSAERIAEIMNAGE